MKTGMAVTIPLIVYMILLVGYGVVSGSRSKKRAISAGATADEDYYLGGRQMNGIVLAFTTVATILSAGTVIGVCGVAYKTGFNWVFAALACQAGMGFLNIGCLGKRWSIVGRRIKAVTLLDFLKARYNSDFIVIFGGISIIAFMGTYMMAQLQGGAVVLQSITGLDYKYGLFIFATVILIYMLIGGFNTVANTDTFQGIFMIIGALALWLYGLKAVGGFSGLTSTLYKADPNLLALPGVDDKGSLKMCISMIIHNTIGMLVIPPAATRAMSYPNCKEMHRSLTSGGIICFIISVSYGFFALVARALIPGMTNSDLAIPQLYQYLFNPWVAGILIAAPFAAMLTTVDSLLLSLASTIATDLYSRYIKPKAGDREKMKINYISVIAIIAVFTIFAINPPDAVQWIVQFGLGGLGVTFAAPVLGGLFWKRANKPGAIVSMVAGVAFYMWATLFTNWNLMKQAPAIIFSFIVFVVVCRLTAPPDRETVQLFWGKYPVKTDKS